MLFACVLYRTYIAAVAGVRCVAVAVLYFTTLSVAAVRVVFLFFF